jgi:mono/diheme cytochrome c family protein
MKIETITVCCLGLTAVSAFRAAPSVSPTSLLRQAPASAPAARSVWDGVYTDAQRKRGAAIYLRACSGCHGEGLKGGEGTRALTGADFKESWNGQTVADLFDKIRRTMPPPPDQPGTLTLQQDADVVAHILSANDFPDGAGELSSETGQLKLIRITTSKP